MKRDKKLINRIKNENLAMPKEMSSNIDKTLVEICSNDAVSINHSSKVFLRLAVAFAAVFAFFLLPNLSSNIAFAMQEIPIIGRLVEVITIRDYEVNDEYHPENVEIPNISYDGTVDELINADIKELTSLAIERFKKEIESLPDAHTGLVIDYETITNNENWFTLRIMIYHDAGSGYPTYKYYHIDKSTGESPKLSTLFKANFDYVSIISDNIYSQMVEKNKELGETVYWVDKTEMQEWEFNRIEKDQNFYFDDNGNIVIVFDKYQVAPGYMGNPEFVVSRDVFNLGLK